STHSYAIALAPSGFSTLPLHDALPISAVWDQSQTAESRALVAAFENTRYFSVRYWAGNLEEIERRLDAGQVKVGLVIPPDYAQRSEEHTSELQSRSDLVCRLLLEKKK